MSRTTGFGGFTGFDVPTATFGASGFNIPTTTTGFTSPATTTFGGFTIPSTIPTASIFGAQPPRAKTPIPTTIPATTAPIFGAQPSKTTSTAFASIFGSQPSKTTARTSTGPVFPSLATQEPASEIREVKVDIERRIDDVKTALDECKRNLSRHEDQVRRMKQNLNECSGENLNLKKLLRALVVGRGKWPAGESGEFYGRILDMANRAGDTDFVNAATGRLLVATLTDDPYGLKLTGL